MQTTSTSRTMAGRQDAAWHGRITVPAGGWAGWLADLGRRWRQRELRGRRLEARRQMMVVETLSLGPRKELVLVSCGGERFLVGTGAEGVQTLLRVGAERVFPGAVQKSAPEARWG